MVSRPVLWRSLVFGVCTFSDGGSGDEYGDEYGGRNGEGMVIEGVTREGNNVEWDVM